MTNTRTSKTAASKSSANGAAKKSQSVRSAAFANPGVTAAAAPAVKSRRSAAPKSSVKPVAAVSGRAEASDAVSRPAEAGAAEPVKPPKAPKLRKAKLVRDKFTMQEQEYQILSDLKRAFKDSGVTVKRSELVRVAVSLLTSHDLPALQALVARLPARKTAGAS